MFGKITTRVILGMVLLVLFGLAAGCSRSQEVRVGEDRNGQKVSIKQDQLLIVRLESNITTGFSWEVAELDEAVLRAEGEAVYEEAKPNQNLAGAGGSQTFKFKPVKAGEVKLKLVYRRPWEKDVEPAKVYEVQVTVY